LTGWFVLAFATDLVYVKGCKMAPSLSSRQSITKAAAALQPAKTPKATFESKTLRSRAFYADPLTLIINADVRTALKWLREARLKVDCVVTSPPFYGQRDYGVAEQIGLEEHPGLYIFKLTQVFRAVQQILKPTGSLWVNLGDTFWSGKGEHKSGETKQSARRFGIRPQDRPGDGSLWCRPKQLLLIPHRFAIAMQDAGWLVRNDNVWVKPNPIPDQVRDRCSMSHEYVFQFTRSRWYFFDRSKVGRCIGDKTLPPLDTWKVQPSRGNGIHKAAFSEDLLRIPVLATTPPEGVVLDPFAGTGTTLLFARKHGFRSIGIDAKAEFCSMMAERLKAAQAAPPEIPNICI
jgi:site-specific DNA-methyltransferase (cytosine-N4-specific)